MQAWDFVNADVLWGRPGPGWQWGPLVTDLELTEEVIAVLRKDWEDRFAMGER